MYKMALPFGLTVLFTVVVTAIVSGCGFRHLAFFLYDWSLGREVHNPWVDRSSDCDLGYEA